MSSTINTLNKIAKNMKCEHEWWTYVFPCNIDKNGNVTLQCHKCRRLKQGKLEEAYDIKNNICGVQNADGTWQSPNEFKLKIWINHG